MPMDIIVWKRIAVLAVIITAATWYLTDVEQVLFGFLGFFVWGWWSINSLEVATYTRCCVRTAEYPGLAFFGVVVGLLCLVPVIDAIFASIGTETIGERVDNFRGFGGGRR